MVLQGCTWPYTYSGKPQQATPGRVESTAQAVDRQASDWLGLEALGDTLPGNTSRRSRHDPVADVRAEAAALDRDADQIGRVAKKQRETAAKYDRQAKEAKADAKRLRHLKGKEALARYNSALRQVGYCDRESRAAIRSARRLEYEADTKRAQARAAMRRAAAIERLTPEPTYKAEERPTYVER